MIGRRSLSPALLLMALAIRQLPASAEVGEGGGVYPVIRSLRPDDPILKQLHEDIAYYHRSAKALLELPPLGVYLYEIMEGDTLFTLAARFNLPYDTLATLNRISSVEEIEVGRKLLVASIPGLFVPAIPKSELERVLRLPREGVVFQSYSIAGQQGVEEFEFLPGERFSNLERAFFLGVIFRFPLTLGSVTSRYGWRDSPITGHRHFHGGMDIGAPRGSEVFPSRFGVVESVGWSDIYGNYITISHQGGYVTLYGHLDSIAVREEESVSTSTVIGRVGSTGQSTGPHLHFELWNPSGSVNPERYVRGVNQP